MIVVVMAIAVVTIPMLVRSGSSIVIMQVALLHMLVIFVTMVLPFSAFGLLHLILKNYSLIKKCLERRSIGD
jgi:hypothetical protein